MGALGGGREGEEPQEKVPSGVPSLVSVPDTPNLPCPALYFPSSTELIVTVGMNDFCIMLMFKVSLPGSKGRELILCLMYPKHLEHSLAS